MRRLALISAFAGTLLGAAGCRSGQDGGASERRAAAESPAPPASVAPADLFADPALERTVRRALEKPTGPLAWGELSSLAVLNADGEHAISKLSGIERLSALTVLDVQQNRIRDLGPISKLKQLVELNVSENGVKDLSPLRGLRRLRELIASGNHIQDIAPLAGLEKLERLYIDRNEIRNLEPLTALPRLGFLMAGHNPIDCSAAAQHLAELKRQTPKITTDCPGYQWFEEVLGSPRR